MDFFEYINKKEIYPVLFIGSGFTKRYSLDSPTWNELLEKCFSLMGREKVEYIAERNLAFRSLEEENENCTENEKYSVLATKIEKMYEKEYLNNLNLEINGTVKKMMENNESLSAFKALISIIFSNLEENTEIKNREFQSIINMEKKVSAIVTTNYDSLLETMFSHRKLCVRNNIIDSEPYNSIYKMHGCVNRPDSMVITKHDYDYLESKSPVLFAQLTTLLFRHPVIFIGYSMTDDSVKKMLRTIFQSLTNEVDSIEKMQENFVVIEYCEGKEDTKIETYSLDLNDGVHAQIKIVKTDQYKEVYNSISKIKQKVTVKQIREIKNLVSIIEDSNVASKPKILANSKLEGIPGGEVVIAIGSENSISMIPTRFQMLSDRLKDDENFKEKYLEMAKNSRILQIGTYAPYLLFNDVASVWPGLPDKVDFQIKKIEEIIENSMKYGENKLFSSDVTIAELLSDIDILAGRKIFAIVYCVKNNMISIDNLQVFLKQEVYKCMQEDSDALELGTTDIAKLVCYYDYLKYEEEIDDK